MDFLCIDACIFQSVFNKNDHTDILEMTFVYLYRLPANLFTFEKRAINQIKMMFPINFAGLMKLQID